MRKKIVALCFAALLPLVLCCACGEEEAADTPAGELLETDAYSVVLPENVTAKENGDGTVTLFLDFVEVGGITVIPYENAEELSMDDILTDDTIRQKLDDLLNLVAPEGKVDHMFSNDLRSSVCLEVLPWPEQETAATIHYFFPQGDQFYDVYFLELLVPTEAENIILDSFTLTP